MADDSITYDQAATLQAQREQLALDAEAQQRAQSLRAEQVQTQQAAARVPRPAAAAKAKEALMAEAEAVVSKMGAWGFAIATVVKFVREHKILAAVIGLMLALALFIQWGLLLYIMYLIVNPKEAVNIGLTIITNLFKALVDAIQKFATGT